MSGSLFHRRFKDVTTMSPLQYQKVLRLHEARLLMVFHTMDTGRGMPPSRLRQCLSIQQGVRTFFRE